MAVLRRALIGAALALTVTAAPALAQTWRMSTKQPADSPEGKVFQRFADLVTQYTNGKMKVQVYPSEQLGKDDAVLEQLQRGTIHLYVEGATYLQKWVPDTKWISAPFLFEDREHWARFTKGPMVQGWLEKARTTAGITVIGDMSAVVRGPYRVLVTKKPVGNLDEMKGLKLRLHPDKLAADVWGHLGTETRVLAWTEVYQSINSGIVQAVNSPIALVESMRFYEVAPHIVRHNEYFQEVAFMTNAKAFDALAPDIKQAVLRAHAEAGLYSQQMMGREAEESIARMKARGVTYSEIDIKPFVARMKEFYAAAEKAGTLPAGFLQAVEAARAKN
ncbi:MAG: TRAP transporter substrate-binding protein [Alphaproteobacteria bacterium]|nr:TRAP transporter substrate-binding protein [Alphaproteobacteria bacterium]